MIAMRLRRYFQHRKIYAALEILIMLGVYSTSSCQAERFIPYRLEAGSRLWIDGSATIGSYKCGTVAVYGIGDLKTDLQRFGNSKSQENDSAQNARILVMVRMFDCGNPAMNTDMYRALKADRDSTIQFALTDAQIAYDSTATTGWIGLRAIGRLSIAGITRLDTIMAAVKSLSSKKYEILGRKKLSMQNFKITPPTAFFGLIKAHEDLVVSFDLIAVPEDDVFEPHVKR